MYLAQAVKFSINFQQVFSLQRPMKNCVGALGKIF